MPAPYSAGSIFLQVVPSFRGVPEQIAREARDWPDKIGKEFDERLNKRMSEAGRRAGKSMGASIAREASDAGDHAGEAFANRFISWNDRSKAKKFLKPIEDEARDSGKRAADAYMGDFDSAMRRAVTTLQKKLPTIKLGADDSELKAKLRQALRDVAILDNAKAEIGIDLEPGARAIMLAKVNEIVREIADKSGTIEARVNAAGVHKETASIAAELHALSAYTIEPDLKIDRKLGLFERTLKANFERMLDDLPPVDLEVDESAFAAKVIAVREMAHELLRNIEAGIDIDDTELMAKLAKAQMEMTALARTGANMKAKMDASGVAKTIAGIRTELESIKHFTIETDVDTDAFSRGLRGALRGALADLGTNEVNPHGWIDENLGQRSLDGIRKKMLELSDRRIGVDITAQSARAQLEALLVMLEKLQAEHWDVRIDSNAAAAAAQVGAFLAVLDRVDGQHVDAHIDVKDAVSSVTLLDRLYNQSRKTRRALTDLADSSGSTERGLRGVGQAGNDGANSFRAFNIRILGVAALGPLVVPALVGIAGAIAALAPMAAAAALGLGVLVLGLMGVSSAFKAMTSARESEAKDQEAFDKRVKTSSRSVEDAQRSLGNARADAARSAQDSQRRIEDALRGVSDAERNLRNVQRDAQQAQEELTRARADAAEQLEDLRLQVRGGALDERQAILDLHEAEKDLADARKKGLEGDDLEEYLIRLERAKLQLDQAKESNSDLAKEQERWARTGIEGSDGVVAAQERVRSSQQAIADAQRSLADAQRSVDDARRDAARQAQDSQQAIADAQRNLSEAQLDYADALAETSSSTKKLKTEMEKLGPAGREFVLWLDKMRPRFRALQSLAQEGFLPGLRNWLDSILNNPKIDTGIRRISEGLGGMFDRFAASLRGDSFGRFFDMINRSGPTFIGQMGEILANLAEGIVELVTAMEPLGLLFGDALIAATRRFQQWAASLTGSRGLKDFFEYVRHIGPKIVDFFTELWNALLNIGRALAPYAEGLLGVLTSLFHWIGDMDVENLRNLVMLITALVLGMQAIFGLNSLAKSLQTAVSVLDSSVGRFVKGAAAFLGPLALFAAAFLLLYTNSEDFRKGVDRLWHEFLEPFAEFLGQFITPLLETLGSLLGDHIEIVAAIAMAWAGWKIILQVVKWVGMLRTALEGLAVAQMFVSATGGVVGAGGGAAVGGAASRIMSNPASRAGMGGLLGGAGAGAAAGLFAPAAIGLGAGLYLTHNMWSSGPKDENVQALMHGGKKAADYRKSVDRGKKQAWDTRFAAEYLPFLASDQEQLDYQNAKESGDVQRMTDEEWKSLSPLEQAQQKVAEWTQTLADRQRSGTATSDELAAAHRRLEHWTGVLNTAQGTATSTTDGLTAAQQRFTESLIDEQNRLIGLADAEYAYKTAKDDLSQAYADYLRVMSDADATEEDRRQATDAWIQQARQTAEAAKATAAARHADADAATQQAYGNAAMLIELNRQKELYGELPPYLENIRQGLENTVDPATLAVAKMEDLGIKIKAVPDSKTIVFDGKPTQDQLDLVKDLGFEIVTLPDGTVTAVAKTQDAEDALAQLARDRQALIIATVQSQRIDSIIKKGSRNTNKDLAGTYSPDFGMATGGFVNGPGTWTSDSIPAYLSNGEYVVRAASVAKYGLHLLDAINAGHYAKGGLVQPRTRGGRMLFADGGLVANWGGTINLSGGDVTPLAALWYEAISDITSLANQGAAIISRAFAGMRDAALGIFGQTTGGVLGQWLPFLGGLTTETGRTRDNLGGIFGDLRDRVLGRTDETRDGVGSRLGQLRDKAVKTLADTVKGMFGHWLTLPGGLAGPVNTIIDKVLNNGLFRAFNAIVGALGLDAKLNIPTQDLLPKLATGGRVPGWSPHPKADNIPAMLTAGEYVHPVDAVQYYGPEFMEAIRKRRIPREAFGIQRYATGGLVELGRRLQQMGALVSEHPAFGGVAMGGHGRSSLHYTGHAIDVNTRPGTSALEQRELAPMERLARALGFRTIFMAPGHYNHLHVDDGGGKSILGALGGLLGDALGALTDPVGMLRGAVDKALSGFDADGSPVKKIMAGGVRKVVDFVADKVTGWMGNFVSDGVELPGGSGPVADQVRAVASQFGWGSGPQWDAINWIVQQESGWRPTAQNPSSTAYGLFQFLNGTWAGTGIGKTSDPTRQALAGMRYIQGRYRDPLGAKAFWQRHGSYADGGPVQDIDPGTGAVIPDLHDTGGWLMPGLNVIMNRTGRPEPTINPQTLDALQSIAEGGGGIAPLIGAYHQTLVSGSPREAVEETMHAVRVLKTGGRYNSVSD